MEILEATSVTAIESQRHAAQRGSDNPRYQQRLGRVDVISIIMEMHSDWTYHSLSPLEEEHHSLLL